MRVTIAFLTLAWFFQGATQSSLPFHTFSYQSQVLGGDRTYRVLLPANYDQSRTRYPVVYWLHGVEREPEARESRLAEYVAAHDLIVVDGGPEETEGQSALYFPELVRQIDSTLRTLADRGHRGVAGIGSGGFMALYLGGKYPDLVSSASSLEGITEADVGPEGFPSEYRLEDVADNYEGVRTRTAQSSADSLAFYHRQLDAAWAGTRTAFDHVTYLAGQDLAEIGHVLDYHMATFTIPLPTPPMFQHTDAWPNFQVWGWDVVSNRRQPGFTVLQNVSNTGFRSTVRESLPTGATIPEVSLTIASPPIYPPGVALAVTYIHLLDGKVRKVEQRADAHGRLNFALTGDAYEVAVSAGPLLAISGYAIEGANWATVGQPVNLRARFWNKGGAALGTSLLRWESSTPGVKLGTPEGRLYALTAGESATLPVTFTATDPASASVRLIAVTASGRLPLEVPVYPAAEPAKDFQIADGRTVTVFKHATQKATIQLGEGNGDGHAAPGETFAILLPDGGALRTAEVFTNDACVDNTIRGSDSWDDYDHAGASAQYSMPSIHLDCEPGHVVRLLARIPVPNGPNTHFRYSTVEFPVWYKNEGK